MAYRVRTDNFEGPFDLLLYLVSRQKVDIGSISITQITDQYLAEVSRMQAIDLEVASDFLLVASTLLEIKAQSLIPGKDDAQADDIEDLTPSEARDELIRRLLEYKKYKNVAANLGVRYETEAAKHTRTFGPGAEFADVMPDFLKDVTLDSLAYVAAAIYARRDIVLLESEHIAAKPLAVEVHVKALHRRIMNKKRLQFSELVQDASPEVVVVTFLALLELYKRAMVDLVQDELFADITVTYKENSGELTLMGDDALSSLA